MPLSPEDVQAIGAMFDAKLDRVQAIERRRRRLWFWFWMVLFIGSSVASWIMAKRIMTQLQAQVADINDQARASRLEYQAQLRRSAEMQAERKAAEVASHYQSKQSQASYEAGLIGSLFRMQAQAAALQKDVTGKAEANAGRSMRTEQDAVDQLDEATKDLDRTEALMNSATGLLMQMLLRNTDPAHNSAEDKLVGSEAEGAAQPPPVVVGPAPAAAPVQPPPAPATAP
jgi:hypothetical protein